MVVIVRKGCSEELREFAVLKLVGSCDSGRKLVVADEPIKSSLATTAQKVSNTLKNSVNRY